MTASRAIDSSDHVPPDPSLNPADQSTAADARAMRAVLDGQRASFLRDGPPPAELRIDRIDRCIGLLVDHQNEIAAAIDQDFGCRPALLSKFTDISGSIGPLKHARDHLRGWMKPEKRRTSPAILGWLGARAEVRSQPLGVVGVIAPWNFPVNLAFAPLACILAAGNRCMLKPSEHTPATSALMARMFAGAFAETEIAVCRGGPDVGAAFSRLPFDHLLFTGATSVAHHIMRAAAEHLVPLTLELGGKSPVIIGRSANMDLTATRVLAGKTMNAGQICLAPDYVLVPGDLRDEFVARATAAAERMFPTLLDNPEYTSVINERHYDRLQALVADARSKGARVIEVNPAHENLEQRARRKIAPTLILDPTDEMRVMQEEIFGPILPVQTYTTTDAAIAFVNARPRPLALYYFGADRAEENRVLDQTTSGGVTVNDVIMHIAMTELPFGGVGPSGMGTYHGIEGFHRFSHRKAVYSEPTSALVEKVLAGMRPPYGPAIRKMLATQIKR
jgi:coniferyl-aldehyde dehydrogenase